MRAHASQASADGGADRTLAAFLRIPRPLFDLVFGREWFVDAAAGRASPSDATSSTGWPDGVRMPSGHGPDRACASQSAAPGRVLTS